MNSVYFTVEADGAYNSVGTVLVDTSWGLSLRYWVNSPEDNTLALLTPCCYGRFKAEWPIGEQYRCQECLAYCWPAGILRASVQNFDARWRTWLELREQEVTDGELAVFKRKLTSLQSELITAAALGRSAGVKESWLNYEARKSCHKFSGPLKEEKS